MNSSHRRSEKPPIAQMNADSIAPSHRSPRITQMDTDSIAASQGCAGSPSVSWNSGVLVRLRRPSVAQSAWSCGGFLKDCDHADGTPAASFVAGKAAPERFTARVARHDIVRCAARCRWAHAGTMSSPARPGGGHMPAGSGACPARPMGHHMPACPGHFRANPQSLRENANPARPVGGDIRTSGWRWKRAGRCLTSW